MGKSENRDGSYYPFGLTMAGISSKAYKADYVENKKKYNGIEFEGDLTIDVYDAQLRELDSQMGRWWQVDPKIDNMEIWSPYASSYDNPIRYFDYLGDTPEGAESSDGCCEGLRKALVAAGGTLNAGLNTVTFGAWPLHWQAYENMSEEDKKIYDQAAFNTQIMLMLPVPGSPLGFGRPPFSLVTPKGLTVPLNPPFYIPMSPSAPGQSSGSESENQKKGGGKNEQHANQKARDAAKEKYEAAKAELEKLKSKANKTKEDKEALSKLEKAVKHQKSKMDNTGENHSRKAKGN